MQNNSRRAWVAGLTMACVACLFIAKAGAGELLRKLQNHSVGNGSHGGHTYYHADPYGDQYVYQPSLLSRIQAKKQRLLNKLRSHGSHGGYHSHAQYPVDGQVVESADGAVIEGSVTTPVETPIESSAAGVDAKEIGVAGPQPETTLPAKQ